MDEFFKSYSKDFIALGGMKSFAQQLNEMRTIYPFIEEQQKGLLPNIQELYPMLVPSTGFLDIIKITLPDLDTSVTNADFLKTVPSLADIVKPLIDYNNFLPSQDTLYESISGLNNIINSSKFLELQSTLGLSIPNTEAISDFLAGITSNGGAVLRNTSAKNTDEETIQAVVDVLADKLPFDELPDSVKSNVTAFRNVAYDMSISVSAATLFVVVLISFLKQSEPQNAATILSTIMAILLWMKDKNKI